MKKQNQEPNLVVQRIEVKAPNRTNVEVKQWRDATRSADTGRRTSLYNLYEDLLLDNVLFDSIDKRITAVANAEITFTRNGEAVDEIDTMIDSEEFETVVREIMWARFWGVTLLEFAFSPNGFRVWSIPRKHIRLDKKQIALKESDEGGVPYTDDFFLEVGRPNDLGLILRSAPFVIYKRNNFGDWAQYVEVYGMPIRTAYYDAYDDKMRIELSQAFERAGAALNNVLPKGCDFKTEAGAASGDGSIYDRLRTACNEELLIGILGQTMTTLDGSSRAQGEVHLSVQEDKHKADRRFVQRILNTKLLPMLERRGYPVSGGYFYFPEQGETLSLTERAAIDIQLLQSGLPMSTQHFYDNYNVARPVAGDDLVVRPASGFDPTTFPAPPDDPDDPQAVAGFLERVRSFFAEAPQVGASQSKIRITNDAPDDDSDTRLIKRVARGEVDGFDAELFARTSGELIEAFGLGWSGVQNVSASVGVDYGVQNDAVVTANETNLYHFSAAKTLAEIQQLNQLYRSSSGFEEYYQQAKELCGKYQKGWARTEYETARLTAESSANYQRLRAQTDLFPYWEYRTVGDERVREEHAELDGTILPANDPRWQKIYPPNGWKCRCRVVPKMKGEVTGLNLGGMRKQVDRYFDTPAWKIDQAQGFGINRGELNEVFSANQMYVRKFPQNAAKYLDKLNFKSYGLPPYTQCLKQATQAVPPYTGTAEAWFAARQKEGAVRLTDRNDRQVVLAEKTFSTHTTKSHADRAKYLSALPGALRDPDEVWLNAERGKSNYDNYTALKYYADDILVVCCRVNSGTANEVRTWYPLAKKSTVIDQVRHGLLVYKKTPQ